MNKNKLLLIGICLLLIIVIIFELFYFNSDNSDSKTNNENSSTNIDNSSTGNDNLAGYGLGDRVGEGKWFLTVNSSKWETINGKSNLVLNITIECKERSSKECPYGNLSHIADENGKTLEGTSFSGLTSLAYATFESFTEGHPDYIIYGGETVTGNFYIEMEKQDKIYLSLMDSSTANESSLGKIYLIRLY